MASDNSFDVVSKVELQEVKNAIDQASKEVHARFDLKDSKSKIELEGTDAIQLASASEYTLKAVIEILSQKLVKRGVSLKNLEFEKLEPAANSSVRQKIKLKQGIASENAKESSSPPSRTPNSRPRPAFRETPSASSPKTATSSRRSWPCSAAKTSASNSSSPTSAPTSCKSPHQHFRSIFRVLSEAKSTS